MIRCSITFLGESLGTLVVVEVVAVVVVVIVVVGDFSMTVFFTIYYKKNRQTENLGGKEL